MCQKAERNIRTMKDQVRTNFYNLPYQSIPKTVLKILVMESMHQLNYFPSKNGNSQYFSSRTILLKK